MADDKKSFLDKLPGKNKEPPRWDDGSDEEQVDEDAGPHLANIIMSIYGGISGLLGAQFMKYLHQVFACNAYGIPLTSRRVEWYSTPQIAADAIIFFFVYAAIFGLGILIGLGVRSWLLKDRPDEKNEYGKAMAHGFFWLVVISVIFLFLPINVFLIGVP